METRIRYKGEPPFTREEALSEGRGTYVRAPETGKHCPVCHCDVVYTENNECVACLGQALWVAAKADPTAFPIGTQSALSLGLEYTLNGQYCQGGPHLKSPSISPNGSKCVLCDEAKKNTPRKVAFREKKPWYMPLKPCQHCGGTHLKRVANGECQGCTEKAKVEGVAGKQLTPRLLAKAAGAMKYMPDIECPYCHGIHMKRVDNGDCDGCRAKAKAVRTVAKALSSSPTIDDNTRAVIDAMGPDYLVDRVTAQLMQLTAYRDGLYCPHGHTGWTYTANNKCVTCGEQS